MAGQLQVVEQEECPGPQVSPQALYTGLVASALACKTSQTNHRLRSAKLTWHEEPDSTLHNPQPQARVLPQVYQETGPGPALP